MRLFFCVDAKISDGRKSNSMKLSKVTSETAELTQSVTRMPRTAILKLTNHDWGLFQSRHPGKCDVTASGSSGL